MPPTVAPVYPKTSDSPRPAAPRVDDTRALDEYLFNPSPTAWLVIDASNQAVPGVAVASLNTGLALVGQGRIAALVGRLRDGAGVVDVDVPGDFGHWITAELTNWLQHRGCWVLTRPSGGAEGRAHVFFAHPDYRYARAGERTGLAATISDYLERFTADIGIPSREVDLRDAVRPLSSPHRLGHHTQPTRPVRAALRALKNVLPEPPPQRSLRHRARITRALAPTTGAARGVIPLEFERWRRALRSEWRAYLLTGRVPTHVPSSRRGDRSLVEAMCTADMVWAIGDPDTAWRVIREAHPNAMAKARTQGQAWWTKYVWNQAVEGAQEWSPAPATPTRAAEYDPQLVQDVLHARDVLTDLQWSLPPRQRASLLLVGHTVLDRIARTGVHRVPCPERDLVLDTGIADRKTIRAALRLLNGRLGTLHRDSFKEEARETSSFEFELNTARHPGVREIPPPAFHPPHPTRGTWAALPRTHSLWRALLTSGTALSLPQLALQAGLPATATSSPSPSNLTTARAALRALNEAGLAEVTAEGTWQATHRPHPVHMEREAAVRYAHLHAVVESERQAYRSTAPQAWRQGRERTYKKMLARQKAWWDGQGDEERRLRTHERALRFHQLPLTRQRAVKEAWAHRRTLAGTTEIEHHAEWLNSTTPDEYAHRVRERTAWFAGLSPAHKGLAIDQWDRFRRDHAMSPDTIDRAQRDRGQAFLTLLRTDASEQLSA